MIESWFIYTCSVENNISIEARLDKGIGLMATYLIQNGAIKVDDYIATGIVVSKERALIDNNGKD